MKDLQKASIIYSGNVQGVGFRFTARDVACRTGVSGFARNLGSGDVEVVCEGTPDQVQRFIRDLGESMREYIADSKIDTSPAAGEFTSFEIRF